MRSRQGWIEKRGGARAIEIGFGAPARKVQHAVDPSGRERRNDSGRKSLRFDGTVDHGGVDDAAVARELAREIAAAIRAREMEPRIAACFLATRPFTHAP